jgi:heat shock protein HslJ
MRCSARSMISAALLCGLLALNACAASISVPSAGPRPEKSAATATVDFATLVGSTWVVEDIDGRGVIDRLQSRLQISSLSQLTGLAGCNSFHGPATLSAATGLRLGPFGTTRRMCAPAVMDQEQKFLDALSRVRAARTANGLLYLQDTNGATILRLARSDDGYAQHADPTHDSALRAYVWSCADAQRIVMRNLFHDNAIEIDLLDGMHRLEQTISASGARYADADMVFWTKGSTATLERKGSLPVQCVELHTESLREDARLRDAD